MDYVVIEWAEPEDDDPTLRYAELDGDRREVRRMEFFQDGTCFSYGGERGKKEALEQTPYPADLRALNQEGVCQAHAISEDLFYQLWGQVREHTDSFMGMFF